MDESVDMDRRAFFRRAVRKTGEAVAREADQRARARAAHWIRPPFALDELEFLLACTRCDACLEACPHGVIFKLPARLGAQVVGTPALDLLNRACRLCEDWPCVTTCEPGALHQPENAEDETPATLPALARAWIDTDTCIAYLGPECGACASACPVPGALTWDMTRPVLQLDTCVGCGMCRDACIVEPKAVRIASVHSRETQGNQ